MKVRLQKLVVLITLIFPSLPSSQTYAEQKFDCKLTESQSISEMHVFKDLEEKITISSKFFLNSENMKWDKIKGYKSLLDDPDETVKYFIISGLFKSKAPLENYKQIVFDLLKNDSEKIQEIILELLIKHPEAQMTFKQIKPFIDSPSIYQNYLAYSAISLNKVSSQNLNEFVKEKIKIFRNDLSSKDMARRVKAAINLSALKDFSSFDQIKDLLQIKEEVDILGLEKVNFSVSNDIGYPEMIGLSGLACVGSCDFKIKYIPYKISEALMNLDFEKSYDLVLDLFLNEFNRLQKITTLAWFYKKIPKSDLNPNRVDLLVNAKLEKQLSTDLLILKYHLFTNKKTQWKHNNHKKLRENLEQHQDNEMLIYRDYLIAGYFAWPEFKNHMLSSYDNSGDLGKIAIIYSIEHNKDKEAANLILDKYPNTQNLENKRYFHNLKKLFCEQKKWY